MLNLKNYTTGISAERTQAEIESLLVEFGAVGTHREYDERRVKAIVFELKVEWGRMAVQMPVDVPAAFRALRQQKKTYVEARDKPKLLVQAERVAWRIWLDWLKVQLSLIQMQKAQPAQVFMPYIWDQGKQQSFFQTFREGQLKLLAAKKEESPPTLPMTGSGPCS